MRSSTTHTSASKQSRGSLSTLDSRGAARSNPKHVGPERPVEGGRGRDGAWHPAAHWPPGKTRVAPNDGKLRPGDEEVRLDLSTRSETQLPDSPEEAKKMLLQILNLHPKVAAAIGAPTLATDEELIESLMRFESPFDALRAAGCDITTATFGAWLLPHALKAPMRGARRRRCPRFRHSYCWFCMVFSLASLLLVGSFAIVIQSQVGWTAATCNLALFDNNTCTQENSCSFQVKIYKADEERMLDVEGWELPSATSIYDGKTFFPDHAFRCCNRGDSAPFDCCGLYDHVEHRFCDNWVGKTDGEGQPCQEGNWDCLYKVQQEGGAQVSALVPYRAPVVWPMIVTSLVLYAGILFCGWESTSPYRKRFAQFVRDKREERRENKRRTREAAAALAAQEGDGSESLSSAASSVKRPEPKAAGKGALKGDVGSAANSGVRTLGKTSDG